MAFSLFSPCAPCCDVVCKSGILCLEVRRCPQDIPTYGNLCDPYYGNPPMSGAYVEFYQQETDEYGITTSGVFVDGGYTGADGRFCAYAPTGLYWASASMDGFYPTGTYITHMPCPPVGIPRWKPVSMYPDKINITVCGGGCGCDHDPSSKTATLTTPLYTATQTYTSGATGGPGGIVGSPNVFCATFSGVPNLGPFEYSWDYGPAYPKPGDTYPIMSVSTGEVETHLCPTGNVVLVTNQCPVNQGTSSTPLIWACKDFSISAGCGPCTTRRDQDYYCCAGGPAIHGPDVTYNLTCPIGTTSLVYRTDLYGNPLDNCSPNNGGEGWWGYITRNQQSLCFDCFGRQYPSGTPYTVYFRFNCGAMQVGWWACDRGVSIGGNRSCGAGCGVDTGVEGFVAGPTPSGHVFCGFRILPDTSQVTCDAPVWQYPSERRCDSLGNCDFINGVPSINPDDHYMMHWTLSTTSGNFIMVIS